MISIQRFFLITAISALQSVEHLLEFLYITRPYLRFGVISLVAGFLIGFMLIRR